MTLDQIADMLEASRQEFTSAATALPPSQGSAKPKPESWSVLECVEHVATVEQRFLTRLSVPELTLEPQPNENREAELGTRVVDRSTRVQAPEPAQPSGRFADLDQALDAFQQARSRTLEFARDRHADLYRLGVAHPRFGHLNGVELMVIIAGHARRHAEQIREVTAALSASAS